MNAATDTHRVSVTVHGDRIIVDSLEMADASLAQFVAQTSAEERGGLVERALRIGLLAMCNAGVNANVDLVRSEFERMVERLEGNQARAAEALDATLRANFADGEGKLPRTLESFLGDSGRLNRLVGDLFDPHRRESAMGRLNDLLSRYFDGDGSQLARLLDPTREGSPLHQFRNEMTGEFRSLSERLTALEESRRGRAEERERSAAKGTDFEDALEAELARLAHGAGDLLERTATDAGDALRSKKGDFVLTIDPARTRGASLRVVVEAKNRSVPRQRFMEELAEARANRGAAVALAVFTPAAAPVGIAPLQLVGTDVWCVHDPEAEDTLALETAVRLARALAITSLRDASVAIDVAAVQDALSDVIGEVQRVQGMKAKLASIGTATRDLSDALDLLRAGVLRGVTRVEEQLRAVEPEESAALSA